MVHFERQLVVPVAQDEAFAYMSRFDSAAEWDPGTKSARMVTPEPVGVGSAFELETVFLGKTNMLRYEVRQFEAPKRLVLVAETATVRATDKITFARHSSGGTVIGYNADLDLKGAARLATPLFAIAFKRIGEAGADGLLAALTARALRAQS